jgi:integrase/recombinase XerD
MSEPNLYKRNGIWWLRATIDGREIRESLRVRDVKAARRIRDTRLEKFNQARSGLPQTGWKEAVTLWADHITGQILPSTAKRYAVSLLQCEPWLGKLQLSDVKSQTISEMARARKTAGASAATIRRDLTAVSRVLTHAASQGLYEGNPTLTFRKTLRERRDPIELPTNEAIEIVIAASPRRFGALIRAAELTGCRLDEIVQAKWRDFDAKEGALRVVKGKGNKSRTISLSGDATAHILGTVRVLGSDVIFCHDSGLPYANASSNFAQICRRIEKVQPSFKRFRFHDLRHLYAVRSLLDGMDLWTLSRQLGHTSVKVTESSYLTFLPPEKGDLARKGSAQNSAQLQRFGEGLEGRKDIVSL